MSVSRSKVSRTPSVRVGCIRVSSVIVRGSRGDFVVDARNRLGRRAQLGKKGQRPLARETHDGRLHGQPHVRGAALDGDRKSTRLNSSHSQISYAVFCLKKKKK